MSDSKRAAKRMDEQHFTELLAHADELEAREKAGADVPVKGMLSRQELEIALDRWRHFKSLPDNVKALVESNVACERALREAQELQSATQKLVMVAEKRITALESALQDAPCKCPSKTGVITEMIFNPETGEIRYEKPQDPCKRCAALAQQPPQATPSPGSDISGGAFYTPPVTIGLQNAAGEVVRTVTVPDTYVGEDGMLHSISGKQPPQAGVEEKP